VGVGLGVWVWVWMCVCLDVSKGRGARELSWAIIEPCSSCMPLHDCIHQRCTRHAVGHQMLGQRVGLHATRSEASDAWQARDAAPHRKVANHMC